MAIVLLNGFTGQYIDEETGVIGRDANDVRRKLAEAKATGTAPQSDEFGGTPSDRVDANSALTSTPGQNPVGNGVRMSHDYYEGPWSEDVRASSKPSAIARRAGNTLGSFGLTVGGGVIGGVIGGPKGAVAGASLGNQLGGKLVGDLEGPDAIDNARAAANPQGIAVTPQEARDGINAYPDPSRQTVASAAAASGAAGAVAPAGIDYGGLLDPTNYQATQAAGNRSAVNGARQSIAGQQPQRAANLSDIQSRVNSIELDTAQADRARQDQEEGLAQQRALLASITGSDGGIGASVDDIVSRYDSLQLDTGLADQSRGEQVNALNLNRGLLDEIRGSQGRFDETANELTSRYDAINVDTSGMDESRGFQVEGLDQQRALLERLMRDDAEVLSGSYANRTLANQMAMARGAGGGEGARQLATNRVQDNAPAAYAAAQREANAQILSQLGIASGVADSFGNAAQGIRGLDLGQAELLSSVDLQKAQGVAQAKQTALNQLLESQGITGNLGASIGSQAGALRGADETRTRTQAELDQARVSGVAQARQTGINQSRDRDALAADIATAFGNQAGAIRNADEARAVNAADLDMRGTGILADYMSAQENLSQRDTEILGQFEQAARGFDIDWARLDEQQRDRAVNAILEEAKIDADNKQAKLIAEGLAYRFEATRSDNAKTEAQRRQDLADKNFWDSITTGAGIVAESDLLKGILE